MTAIVRIPFHGAEIHTILADAGPLVVLKPTVEAMGLDYSAQLKKLKTRSWATVAETATVAEDGKNRSMTTVDLDTWAMLLANIDENRVAPDLRELVVQYQRESSKALRDYWTRGASVNPRATAAQLGDVIDLAHRQARLLQTINGLVDPKWLEASARELVSRALGKELELPAELMPLYVPDFLKGKGLDASEIGSVQSWFGRRVVEMGQANSLALPELRPRQLPNGEMRETRAWTREHLPLFEEVWDTYYAEQYARPMFMVGTS